MPFLLPCYLKGTAGVGFIICFLVTYCLYGPSNTGKAFVSASGTSDHPTVSRSAAAHGARPAKATSTPCVATVIWPMAGRGSDGAAQRCGWEQSLLRPQPSVRDYGLALRSLAQGRSWRSTVELLQAVEVRRVEANLVIFNTALTAQHWPHALHMLKVSPVSPQSFDAATCGALLHRRCDWHRAFFVVAWALQAQIQLNLLIFNSLLARSGPAWPLAAACLDGSLGLVPNLTSFNTYINEAGASLSAWWHAGQSLKSMVTAQVERDNISYNSGIKACQDGKVWRSALHVFHQMPAEGVFTSARSFGSSIAAAAIATHWPSALSLHSSGGLTLSSPICGNAVLSGMADWTLTVSFWQQMRHREVEHSVVTYGTVLAQLAWRTGALLLQELLSQVRLDPNVISYNCVMNACAEEGLWVWALHLLQEMCAMELCPSLVSRNVVLSALAKAAEWPKALRWWEEMAEVDEQSGNTLIDAMAEAKQWQRALFVLEALQEPVAPVVALNGVLKAMALGVAWAQAINLFITFMEEEDSQTNAISLSSAVNACARARKWQMALSLLSSLRSTEVVPDTTTCNSAINACSSQWWHSFDLLCCMPSPDHLTYGSMLSACASQGLWPTCLEVLKFQQKHRVSPQLTSYTSTLAACHRSGQWLFAMLMVVSFSISADVVGYNNLISACAQDAQWRRAMRLLHTDMPNSTLRPDSISFGGVIHACAERAQWQAALCLLEQLLVTQPPSTTIVASCMAACTRAAQYRRSLDLLSLVSDLDPVLLTRALLAAPATPGDLEGGMEER
ncbi:unnamed protein product [Durusdinium trenchii]|uniref:Pentatricopeptide repeat-containing protein, chloroplastic n=1 Tax=Durusdinium trenchii TaxID=1381693 RepID=A0ABP0K6U4_9DINO